MQTAPLSKQKLCAPKILGLKSNVIHYQVLWLEWHGDYPADWWWQWHWRWAWMRISLKINIAYVLLVGQMSIL